MYEKLRRIALTALAAAILPTMVASCSKLGKSNAAFRFNNGTEIQGIDPAAIQGVPEHRVHQALFEGLTTPDAQTAKPLPGVAESWETSEDGLTVTFYLRKNAKWSDGYPVTAHDFEFGVKREIDPATAAAYAFIVTNAVKGAAEYNAGRGRVEDVGIKALDDYTLQFTLTSPTAYFVEMTSHYAFAPIPRHVLKNFGKDWAKPEYFVGNGPFKLISWKLQDRLVVEKNPNYWDAAAVKLRGIVFLPIEDAKTAYNMYKRGELDGNAYAPVDMMDELALRDDLQSAVQLGTFTFNFNNKRGAVADPRVRKALSLALDRKTMTEKVLRGGEVPTGAFVPPMDGYNSPITLNEDMITNVAEARALLAEAGYPGGRGLPVLDMLYNTSGKAKALSEYAQSQWQINLGVKANLRNQEWKTYLQSRIDLDYDVVFAGWLGDYRDPNTFLDLYLSGGSMNDIGYANPRFDGLVKRAAVMPAGQARYDVLAEAEKVLLDEDQAIMPLYHSVSRMLIDTKKWGGWYPNVMDFHAWKYIYRK